MAITAKSRVPLRLTANTALSPSEVLDVVRQAAATIKNGGGMNALNFSVLMAKGNTFYPIF